jgi:phosphoribosyl 1,2-cyclic phosphate phosphodiesterase
MIACSCPVCTSADPRNRRTRASIHVVMDGLHVQVDAAPEFRLQCLREGVRRLDFFILTHGHADHVAGMDDLRRFCDLAGGEALTVYSTEEGMARVLAVFPYAIAERPISRGYVAFNLLALPAALELPQGVIQSTLLPHGGINTLGLIFTERSSGKNSPTTPTASACRGRRLNLPAARMPSCSMGCGRSHTPRICQSMRQ